MKLYLHPLYKNWSAFHIPLAIVLCMLKNGYLGYFKKNHINKKLHTELALNVQNLKKTELTEQQKLYFKKRLHVFLFPEPKEKGCAPLHHSFFLRRTAPL